MKEMSDSDRARLDAIQQMVRIEIDGDWDARMIDLAFDELERLVEGRPSTPPPEPAVGRGGGRGRRR